MQESPLTCVKCIFKGTGAQHPVGRWQLLTRLRRWAKGDDLAVGIGNLSQIQNFQTIFGGLPGYGDLIAGFEPFAVPSIMGEVIGRSHFHGPFRRCALWVSNLQSNERMRLNKMKFLYGSGQRKRMFAVVRRAPMMRERGEG